MSGAHHFLWHLKVSSPGSVAWAETAVCTWAWQWETQWGSVSVEAEEDRTGNREWE